MPFTNDQYLPTDEELRVDDVEVSAAVLRASAHHLGKYCDWYSKEFMLCSEEEKDPRKCFREGIAVTQCERRFFQTLKANCAEEFTKYWKCIDHSQGSMKFTNCRKPQAIYDKCVLEKMNQERPENGYFCKARLHKTRRPKPHLDIPLPDPVQPPKTENMPVPESVKLGPLAPGF